METIDNTRRTLEERIRNLELENRQYNPHFFSSQEGNPPIGGLGVLMMHDLYVYFLAKQKGSVPKTILYYFPCLALCPWYHLGSCRNFN